MRMLSFPNGQMMTYVNTGKFKAPSDDWQHANLYLAEYELFVMTEGTLYLSYNEERFTVERGEYLLLPPCKALSPHTVPFTGCIFPLSNPLFLPPPRQIRLIYKKQVKIMLRRNFGSHKPARSPISKRW